MIIKTNLFIPKRFDAICLGPVILIRPEYANDKGLIEHEKTHTKQWVLSSYASFILIISILSLAIEILDLNRCLYLCSLISMFVHPILYKLNKNYRFESELEAHQVQYLCDPGCLETIAKNFKDDYGFKMSLMRAKNLIRGIS
jgi:hypothetical protein